MAQYVYGDDNGHTKELEMSFADADRAIVLCDVCDSVMHRIPQAVMVNWNGLPPHEADRRPQNIKQWLDNAGDNRAKYQDTERKK